MSDEREPSFLRGMGDFPTSLKVEINRFSFCVDGKELTVFITDPYAKLWACLLNALDHGFFSEITEADEVAVAWNISDGKERIALPAPEKEP